MVKTKDLIMAFKSRGVGVMCHSLDTSRPYLHFVVFTLRTAQNCMRQRHRARVLWLIRSPICQRVIIFLSSPRESHRGFYPMTTSHPFRALLLRLLTVSPVPHAVPAVVILLITQVCRSLRRAPRTQPNGPPLLRRSVRHRLPNPH